jgi:hypothetical protein
MLNPIVAYRRTEGSPLAYLPRMSRACFTRWLLLGTWVQVMRQDGTVEWRA